MMLEASDAIAMLSRALHECSTDAIKAALRACDDIVLESDEYPSTLFAGLSAEIVPSKEFASCDKSWLVLHHFYDNAETLSFEQRVALAATVAATFGTTNPKRAFIAGVVLAEVCQDEGLAALLQLLRDRPEEESIIDALRTLSRRGRTEATRQRAAAAISSRPT